MDKEDFVAGDVVYLKSGGPAMTVNPKDASDGVRSGEYLKCTWGNSGAYFTMEFPAACLTKNNPGSYF